MMYPYDKGWPTDPFAKLTPEQMKELLKNFKPQYEEALL